jgi:hypothetical protein
MVKERIGILIVALWAVLGGVAQAQRIVVGADTPESAAMKGMGAYLRGAGSYNLNTAKAESIHTDSVIRWKQDLRRIAVEYRADKERQQAGKKHHLEDVKKRVAAEEYELRTNPTATDIQTGRALNALLFDLMDPDIKSNDWYTKKVQLPKEISVKDLIFRFMPARGAADASKVLSRGAIALSRLDVKGENWPTVMKDAVLEKERRAYETAYAKLRDELLSDKFNVRTLLALDASLDALKSKVQTAVPKERGFRDEAVKFVDELRDATRMFDAVTVDYAREILVDTKDQEATTVAELVSFMLKYRLQFATAERSPSARVLYGQIYEVMRQQMDLFGIKPPEEPAKPAGPVVHAADAPIGPFEPNSVWSNGTWTLTVTKRKGETFEATYSFGENECAVTGTIKGNQISWNGTDVRKIRGTAGGANHSGMITSNKDGDKIDLTWRNAQGRSGTLTIVRRKGK